MNYKDIISDLLSCHIVFSKDHIKTLIEIPPELHMGDFSFPCFELVKILNKSPHIIAEELICKIYHGENRTLINKFEKIQAEGPYINFYLCRKEFVKDVIEEILLNENNYGKSNEGEGKNIFLQCTSLYISTPLHVSELFAIILGNSLYKIFQSQGYNTKSINHINDLSRDLGNLIYSYKLWGNEKALEENPLDELLRINIKFHEESIRNSQLKPMGKKYLKKLQDEECEEFYIWSNFKELSLREQDKIYDLLNIKFDFYAGDSLYNDKIQDLLFNLHSKGFLVESNGADIVLLNDDNMPPYIIKKEKDGGFYECYDLVATIYRKNNYNFYKYIYISSKNKSLHFNQMFAVIRKMGYSWADDCLHGSCGLAIVKYDTLTNECKNTTNIKELLKYGIKYTQKLLDENYPKMKDVEEISKKLAINSMIFYFLKKSREVNVEFNWSDILSSNEETYNYVNNIYLKGVSLLTSINYDFQDVDYSKLTSSEEFCLIKELYNFSSIIKQSLDELQPFLITKYIIHLTKLLNNLYSTISVEELKKSSVSFPKIALVKATLYTISNGLNLLGVEIIDKE